ncbi:uncharacterized protein LOC112031960 [Quercus suber]|uniref:uncharacterized protein LOC112031960 n=1 Tax=Quercus suber TaxID=58331 RepID=UPI0032DFDAD1
MWKGIAVCVVFSPATVYYWVSGYTLACNIVINKRESSDIFLGRCPNLDGIKSSHLVMSYVPSEVLSNGDRAVLNQIDENVFLNMEVRFRWLFYVNAKVKNCGFRIVYEQDINGIKEMISAQSSNSTCITPYEGLDVRHDFDNSTEGINLKRSRDEYDGAGPSGEGCSNDVPHSRRIQIYRKDVWLMVALTMVTLIAGFLIKVFQDYPDLVSIALSL